MLKKLVMAVGAAVMVATIALGGGGAAAATILDEGGSPSEASAAANEPARAAEGPVAEDEDGAGETGATDAPEGDSTAAETMTAAVDESDAAPGGAADDAEQVDVSEPPIQVAASRPGALRVSFFLERLTLTDGHVRGTTMGNASAVPSTVTGAATDIYSVTGSYGDATSTGLDLSTAYRINQLGAPTEFWVATRVHASGVHYESDCTVFRGDPDAGGVYATQFVCTPNHTQAFPNAQVRFDISMNRDAEAWGIIQTAGSVSLVGGTFEPELPYHIDGTPEVAASSSTSFNVVLRQGDVPLINASAATTAFVYRIAENGTPTQFYIAGFVQTLRGGVFHFNSKCAVYDGDPRKSPNPIEAQTAELASPYDCRELSGRALDYRGNHEFTFEVARRQMTVVTNPLQQKTLLSAHCSGNDVSRCGYALASVTATVGKGREVSSRYNNTTDVNTESTYSISGTESATIAIGMEIAFGFEYTTLFGKVTGSVKTSFNRSTTSSTTTVSSYKIPIPAHSTGWIEATPPMVHTEGTIIVFDGSRYFELPNVYADLPDAGRQWEYTVRNAPLIGAEPGADTPDDPAVALEPITASAAPRALAATGSSSDNLIAGGVTAAVLLGGGLVLLLLRRGLARRSRRT